MRYLLVVMLCLLFSFSTFSQDDEYEYAFKYDEKLYPNYLHFFPETEENIFILKAKNYSAPYYVYKIESFQLNKATQKVTRREVPSTLEFRGRLKIFFHDNKYYFLETNTQDNFIQLQSLAVDATELSSERALIELNKRERFLTSFQKEDKIYILTALKKEATFQLYKITTPNKVEKIKIDCPDMPLFYARQTSRTVIDYSTRFSLSNLTSTNKVYIDDDFLTISILNKEKEREIFYRHNLSDNTTTSKELAFADGWFNMTSTYYQGNIYRTTYIRKVYNAGRTFHIDAFHFNNDEAFYTYSHEKGDYPFSFQASSPYTRRYSSYKTETDILRQLKNTHTIIYPEKQGDSTVIYFGGLYETNNGGGTTYIPGTTVNTPGGTFTTPSTTMHHPGRNSVTEGSDYILIATNLTENGLSKETGETTKEATPLVKSLPNKVQMAKNRYKASTVAIYKVGDEYHGTCFSRKNKTFYYFKL